ncbi:MFS transporter [Alicyclobacillus shizuokensis]|uniref:MFS transporter n=1 Tax=Alicyclobacillus shizuokensis TaxID=392014 RepID=UPI000AFE672B|nr:MFS transporter [Alicyclobacillus shizuokensis]MCL6627491.1 MFS transporter [Alicyclobacillus shizuokensis]
MEVGLNTETWRQTVARLERIPVWALPYQFILVIGLGFLFTFYDIFDSNVSFIQTCVSIIPGFKSEMAGQYLGMPILMNLLGYVVGTLVLSPISDKIGRRNMLLITMLITGLGSLCTAFTTSYWAFVVFRGITGIGIGADLAVVNTYIAEVAPTKTRAKYTALIFIFSALGALVAVWIGLWLTTPAAPFPAGLPFALGASLPYGWRIMYWIGAVLALIAVLMRFRLPESPRWLLAVDRGEEAERVVAEMEATAARHAPLPQPVSVSVQWVPAKPNPYGDILNNATYIRRVVLLFCVWLFSYVTVYGFSGGMTSLLVGLHYDEGEAGMITAVGVFGMVLSAVFAYWFGERLERKVWLILSALTTILGGVLIGLAGSNLTLAMVGSVILFLGENFWVPIAYAWTSENFPARARTSGFALVDGVGHIGAGIGIWAIAPLVAPLGALKGFLFISGFLFVAAVIALFGVRTKDRTLEEISP